jgi:hypothetical protein
MPDYPRLDSLMSHLTTSPVEDAFAAEVIPYLVSVWLDDYDRLSPKNNIVETTTQGFSYLFDLEHERLIAAWGISKGKSTDPRDKSRMAGHPLSAGPLYHRGHAIPHTLGGPTDINLVPQRGSVNVGAFRVLERQAVLAPGSLYFTYWIYGHSVGQTPTAVQQGLLSPGCEPARQIVRHAN